MNVTMDTPMTLDEIARRYNVSLAVLEKHNPGVRRDQKVSAVEVPNDFARASLANAAAEAAAVADRDGRSIALGATPTTPATGQLLRLQLEKDYGMQQRIAASKALFAQHTVTPPSIGFAQAVKELEAFSTKTEKLPADAFAAEVAKRPDIQDAAVAFLKYRYTPLDFAAIDADADYQRANSAAIAVASHMSAARQPQLAEVLLNVAHPANHQALWPAVLARIPAAELDKLLSAAVRSGNELHANNALHMPYYVYGRRPGYVLGAGARAEIERAIQDFKSDAKTNLLVRQGLDDVRLP